MSEEQKNNKEINNAVENNAENIVVNEETIIEQNEITSNEETNIEILKNKTINNDEENTQIQQEINEEVHDKITEVKDVKEYEKEGEKVNTLDDDDGVEMSSKTGLIKYIFILLFIIILGSVSFLLFLQYTIKLSDIKDSINKEIRNVITSKTGDLNPDSTILYINGNIQYKSFPFPQIIVNDIKGENITYEDHKITITIPKILVNISIVDILTRKIKITKANIIDMTVEAHEYDTPKFIIFNDIIGYIQNKITAQNNIILTTSNTNILISSSNFHREFNNINLNIHYHNSTINIEGDLLSNKQPLKTKIDIKKINNIYDIKINLNSQAFNLDNDLKLDLDNKKYTGNISSNIVNLQVFARTLFNPNSFLYKRIIDNANLKLSCNILYENDILQINDINLDGKNIVGIGKILIHTNYDPQNNNKFDFNITNINIDKLMVKSLSGKYDNNLQVGNISIFKNLLSKKTINFETNKTNEKTNTENNSQINNNTNNNTTINNNNQLTQQSLQTDTSTNIEQNKEVLNNDSIQSNTQIMNNTYQNNNISTSNSLLNNININAQEINVIKKPTYLSLLLLKNNNEINIKIDNIYFNQADLKNNEIKILYSKDGNIKFNNILINLPGNTSLNIKYEDDKNKIELKGESIITFNNFLQNVKEVNKIDTQQTNENTTINNNEQSNNIQLTSNQTNNNEGTQITTQNELIKQEESITIDNNNTTINKEEKKDNPFSFNGNIVFESDKLFINNAIYKIGNDFSAITQFEILLNNGISYIAVNIDFDDLKLDNILKQNNNDMLSSNFKNKILFLNNFTLHTFLNFNIKNLIYKDIKLQNYSFLINSSQGLLKISHVNLDNKIGGSALFDIVQLQPAIQLNIFINNLEIDKRINFNEIMFWLPIFEDFYGSLNVVGQNIRYQSANIQNLNIQAEIKSGAVEFNTFDIQGLGGKCKIQGHIAMQYDRKINLIFNGCTADLKELLPLFMRVDNISGLVGFSGLVYSQGINIMQFINNYIAKAQFIGSGITVNRLGITTLNSTLFSINSNEKLANKLNVNDMFYNKDDNTIFKKLSGTANYSTKQNGTYNIVFSRPLINGKSDGTFQLLPDNNAKIDGNFNFVILSGTLEQIIPLNISIAISGDTINKLQLATNFTQVDSYVETVKAQLEALNKDKEEALIQEKLEKEVDEDAKLF